jgi:hypothetical protein
MCSIYSERVQRNGVESSDRGPRTLVKVVPQGGCIPDFPISYPLVAAFDHLYMTPPLPPALRDNIVRWRMQYGYTYRHIAELANCSIGTVTNILQCHHLYGQSTNPFGQRPGRTPFLDAGDLTYLDNLLEREPCL